MWSKYKFISFILVNSFALFPSQRLIRSTTYRESGITELGKDTERGEKIADKIPSKMIFFSLFFSSTLRFDKGCHYDDHDDQRHYQGKKKGYTVCV